MRTANLFLAAVLLFASSLAAQVHEPAKLDELIERVHELHRAGIVIPFPPTPADFQPAAAKVFDVDAHQFAFTFNPSPFVVNQGDSVQLRLRASDSGDGSGHGFFLERYVENSLTLPRNQTFTINFVASEAGTFFFFCTVTCGTGHFNMSGTFIVNAVVTPTITSFTPATGPNSGGTSVAITGTNFASGATVKFGSVASTNVTVNSETSITAIAPAQAVGSVPITVTNPDTQSATSSQQFTYVEAGPSIASIAPDSGPSSGGTSFTITGSGFATGATVKIGGFPALNATVTSATTITATTPPGPNNVGASGAPHDVIVTNPDTKTTTKTGGFTYTLPAPAIASIAPNKWVPTGGAVVTITGTGFTTALATTVTFGGTAATNVIVIDPATLRVTIPAHAEGAV
ncbi:MAG TPA: IPT/TIG domain-containing protein, partial [Thermoanaerobaculia bacterium]|nr:IPT/TIG domain-containing protein [Thermoanaerobaculia bacterium]